MHQHNQSPQHHDWTWLERGHVDDGGLCEVCGGVWPCQFVSTLPYASTPAWGPTPVSLSLAEHPAVYGYVRTVARGRARVWHWQRELRLFCDQAGLRLVHCFCDVGRHQAARTQPEGYSRSRPYVELAHGKYGRNIHRRPLLPSSVRPLPAFRVLVSILEQRTVYGVVVPSIFHLSTERDVAIARMRYIEYSGKKVLVVPENGVGVRSQASGLFDELPGRRGGHAGIRSVRASGW